MKFLKLIIITILTCNISFANDNLNLTELFSKLDERGIIIGEDISSDDLYRIIQTNNIKHQDMNEFANQISNLLDSSLVNKQKIIDTLKQNPNSTGLNRLLRQNLSIWHVRECFRGYLWNTIRKTRSSWLLDVVVR